MMRAEILAEMTKEERLTLHYLIMDARQYCFDHGTKRYAQWALLEADLIRVSRGKGDYPD